MTTSPVRILPTTGKNFTFFHDPVKGREKGYLNGVTVNTDGLILISEEDYHAAGVARSKGNSVFFTPEGVISILGVKKAKAGVKWHQKVSIVDGEAVSVAHDIDYLLDVLTKQRDDKLYQQRFDLGEGRYFLSDLNTMEALSRYLVDKENDQLKTLWRYSDTAAFEVSMADMISGYRVIIIHHATVRTEYATMRADLERGVIRDYMRWLPNETVGEFDV